MESGKKFREWNPGGYAERAVTPGEVIPEGDLVFFVLETIPRMDLSAFYAYYEQETRGAPPFDVAMMCTLLVYSYSVGVYSSRKIAAASERNLAFMAIVGPDIPDFRTISDFRKIHLDAFQNLFVEVLRLAGRAGMVKLGNIALDGSKFKANASRHKAMSYGYMEKELERLRAEIQELTQRAHQTDAEEDAALGSRRGDELPEELKRRETRLAVIEAAMQRLEAEAREKAQAQQQERDEAAAKRKQEGKKGGGRTPKPIDPTPENKAQTNFTDPEAKIMKTSNKGFDYCINGQVVVDEAHQIIIGADVTSDANDKQQAVPMAAKTRETLKSAGIPFPTESDEPQDSPQQAGQEGSKPESGKQKKVPMSMDNGYMSEEAVLGTERHGFDPHIAVGRQKHHQPLPETVEGPPPDGSTVKEAMAHKLRTAAGRACYAKRKHIVEPVFGQLKHVRGFRQFHLRGLAKVRGEWNLVCLTHNLLKIWRHQCALT